MTNHDLIDPQKQREIADAQRVSPLEHPVDYLTKPVDDPLRPHVYDGIQEFDKRLPNWWLVTLYGTIVYSLIYWIALHRMENTPQPGRDLDREMTANRLVAERNAGVLTDGSLWQMSKDATFVDAGKATFTSTCASCHMADLSGQIGPNLKDQGWIHGGTPLSIHKTISEGVMAKGMPAWAPILGKEKITELTAYILSLHHEGEPVLQSAGWKPGQAPEMAL